MGITVRGTLGVLATVALCASGASAASAASPAAHGQPLARFNANQSNNWFGYNQGTLEQGGKLFNSIAGDWIVPTATQHTRGQDEYSSDWIGIGGGCVDAGCSVGDNTLIQTGTEQDVSKAGKASYGAWWEIIPGPSIDITTFTPSPGDHMRADITETVPDSNVWNITLTDITKRKTFTQTVPYSSTHATAEWIEETPLLIGTNAGLAPLPNLTTVPFTAARTNGTNARLKPSEEMQLVDANGKVIGAPSAPISTKNGFSACAWATTC